MRLRGLPCARTLPRLRTAELAVRFDPRAPDATHAPRAFHTWHRARASQRGVPAASRIDRADPEHPDTRAAGWRLCGGRPDMQADPACRGSNDSRAMASDAARTHRTTPCCRSCPHPSIRFIRLTERRRRSPAGQPAWRPPRTRGTDGSRASGAGHAPRPAAPGATVRLAGWKGNHGAAHRPHTLHRVSTHTARARHPPAIRSKSQLYRGH